MELLILRHGKADDDSSSGDFDRQLLEKGRIQARRAGDMIKAIDFLPEIVLTSPLARARQTADEFCRSAAIPSPVIVPWLASGMVPETALNELISYREFQRVAIIGHNPDLSELIQWILGSRGNTIEIKKGTISCLRVYPPAKLGTLLFHVPSLITEEL